MNDLVILTNETDELSKRELLRLELTDKLISMLPTLRTYLCISQQELAEYIGVSRQTYCAWEQGKRKMTWSVVLSLFLFFYINKKTRAFMEEKPHFMNSILSLLKFPMETLLEDNTINTSEVISCDIYQHDSTRV